jgi:hypothetical protein
MSFKLAYITYILKLIGSVCSNVGMNKRSANLSLKNFAKISTSLAIMGAGVLLLQSIRTAGQRIANGKQSINDIRITAGLAEATSAI